jgi:Trypsin-like peptidase domain
MCVCVRACALIEEPALDRQGLRQYKGMLQVPLAFCAARVATSFVSWHTRWATAAKRPPNSPPTVLPPPPVPLVPPRTSQQGPGRSTPPKPWDRAGANSRGAPTLVKAQTSAPDLATPGPAPQGPCSGASMAEAVAAVRSSIVAVMAASGAWATGVLMSSDGLILTNAHLLQSRKGSDRQSVPKDAVRGGNGPPVWPLVRVLLASPGTAPASWAPGEVVYVFSGPLDLAVLRLLTVPPGGLRPISLKVLPECHLSQGIALMPSLSRYCPNALMPLLSRVSQAMYKL